MKSEWTIERLKALADELENFTEWYWEDNASSSESSDARTTCHVIRHTIDYGPEKVEEDKIEEKKWREEFKRRFLSK